MQENEDPILSKHEKEVSRTNLTLLRCIYLFCAIFSLVLTIEFYLPLNVISQQKQIFKQSVSLMMIAAEIFTLSFEHCVTFQYLPPLSFFYKNCVFNSLMVFHFHAIFGFSWNPYVYLILAAFTSSHFIKQKVTLKDDSLLFLLLKMVIICLTTILGLRLQDYIDIDWKELALLPTLIMVILHFWIAKNTIIGSFKAYYFEHRIKQQFPQRTFVFVTLTFLFLAYYAIIIRSFASNQVYKLFVITYFILSITFFAITTYLKDQLTIILCNGPKTAYRHTQTIFNPYFYSIKKQHNIKWDIQYCVICYKQEASVIMDKCKHLTYCQPCHQKMVIKKFIRCPICKCEPYFRKVYIIDMGQQQRKGYDMKFHLKSKLLSNQYLIKRQKWY